MFLPELSKAVAIGPMNDWPSTEWVGRDILEYYNSQSSYKMASFESFNSAIPKDIEALVIIKDMPPLRWIIEKNKRGISLIYIPVDYFSSHHRLIRHVKRLEFFDKILTHNARLEKIINAINPRTFPIEHHLKYDTRTVKDKPHNGPILWVGHLEYIPPLIKTLKDFEISGKIIALTQLNNFSKKRIKIKKAISKLGIPYQEVRKADGSYQVCGIQLEQWTPSRQIEALKECRAAFDTKSESFGHTHKPPTKAQKYVLNGIPFATDKNSYSYEYFCNRGYQPATLQDQAAWLSDEFFIKTQEFAKINKEKFSLQSVTRSYIEIINSPVSFHKKKPAIRMYLEDIIQATTATVYKGFSRIKSKINAPKN